MNVKSHSELDIGGRETCNNKKGLGLDNNNPRCSGCGDIIQPLEDTGILVRIQVTRWCTTQIRETSEITHNVPNMLG